jgi:hypothetical protein
MVFLKKLLTRQHNKNVMNTETIFVEFKQRPSTCSSQKSATVLSNTPAIKQIIQFESGIGLLVHNNSVSTFDQNRV